VQYGDVERQLVHPTGGLEGYSPAEVQAEQMREQTAKRFELLARRPDRRHARRRAPRILPAAS
jgi:hypothetical protein